MARSRLIPQEKTNLRSRSVVKTQRKKEVFNRFKTHSHREHHRNEKNTGLWMHFGAIKVKEQQKPHYSHQTDCDADRKRFWVKG